MKNGEYYSLPAHGAKHKGTPSKRALYSALVALACLVVVAWNHITLSLLPRSPILDDVFIDRAAEELFLSIPNEETCLANSRHFTRRPHVAGTAYDLSTAIDFMHLLQKELGIDAPPEDPIFKAGSTESRNSTLSIPTASSPYSWIDTYYPLMNVPLDRSLQVLDSDGHVLWEADLEEKCDETDPEAGRYHDYVPAFHGYGKDADVTGELVFANYGAKEDFDTLVGQGINFTGKIVLARYGANSRGLKVKAAQDVGAAGVLIYTDTRDDGSVTEANGYKPYPHGPARNPNSIERGTVAFITAYPGDPTTPDYPAYENATRMESLNVPNIPSLPLSSANAAKLLQYYENGGASVRLVNHAEEKIMHIWNAMAVIPGYVTDEVVMVGNHRDDPTSGTVILAEVARALGALLKTGWKPLRTIVFASWDAEEYGGIGSTEWAEDFPDFIHKHIVGYLNMDSPMKGSQYWTKASPLLAHLVQQTAMEIVHPTDSSRSLWDATSDVGSFQWHLAPKIRPGLEKVGALGSGSDYTVFLQRIGVLYHYHSVFDSERWMETYGDPGFFKHISVAKHLGLQMMRLSNTLILPFNTTHYSLVLEQYLDEVATLASANSIAVDLTLLRDSIQSLQAASIALDGERTSALHAYLRVTRLAADRKPIYKRRDQCHSDQEVLRVQQRVRAINAKLVAFERGFISQDGIPGREWFKNIIISPAKWGGYGATTFPALTESITAERSVTLAQYEAERLSRLFEALAEEIRP
ncbi:Zn-dependent exopeptidase [Hymenopellis radicata]|nr:Zn-dependent exopeptidase [Hymenopellis radicata]